MAQLWGGRFSEETDALVKAFNDSISFDKRLWEVDITGSTAHARMLGACNVISNEDSKAIIDGLKKMKDEIASGDLVIDESFEDIHSFVEAELTSRIGDAAKKLHTGRSRNDQVALDMRLYVRGRIEDTYDRLMELLCTLIKLMESHGDYVMPGFTHMQKAQPTTLSHHLGAYFEMFYRDIQRLMDNAKRMNYSPLGAGALCGTTYPLDRDMTAKELGFVGSTENSMDSVSDRDYLMEYLFDLSLIMMHLSRFSEEIITWNSNEYGFIELSDAYSTGSSIMPQKKNPDICELIRGKTGRVYGALNSLLVTMKGIPLAYNKDMQEDKEVSFDAFDTADSCILLFTKMMETSSFNKEKMERSAKLGFTNATDCADYLVKKGMPFRDAHEVTGRLVVLCIDRKCALDDLSLEVYREYSDLFSEDIFEAISLETVVEKRVTKGSPGPVAMKQEISSCKMRLEALKLNGVFG